MSSFTLIVDHCLENIKPQHESTREIYPFETFPFSQYRFLWFFVIFFSVHCISVE